MEKPKLYLFLYFCAIAWCAFPQNNGWTPSTYAHLENKMTKADGNIRYFVNPKLNIAERDSLIELTAKYIRLNLALIEESSFNDSVYIVFAGNKDEMIKYVGTPISGVTLLKDDYVPENMIYCIPKVLKHELMHMLVLLKWKPTMGDSLKHPSWLEEGLAVYADPEAEDLGHKSIEGEYALLYQNKKLLPLRLLNEFPTITTDDTSQIRIAYIQSGYIVKFLIERYGIGKLKKLWVGNVDFNKIYGIDMDGVIKEMNKDIGQKYFSSPKYGKHFN
jgi:hypothetical protein